MGLLNVIRGAREGFINALLQQVGFIFVGQDGDPDNPGAGLMYYRSDTRKPRFQDEDGNADNLATETYVQTFGNAPSPVPVALGGTEADNAADARDNLGAAEAGAATAAGGTGASGGTAPAFTGTALQMCGHVNYGDLPAAEATAGACTIVSDVAISAVALTIAAQPKVPSKLNIIITDGDSSTDATLTIVGVGPGGEAIVSEIVTIAHGNGSHTYTTVNAYSSVTSATVSALSGNTGADKIAIGHATAVGLPIPSGAASVSVFKATVAATPAGVPADDTVGTVDTTARTIVPNTAADDTKGFEFWFKYTVLPAGSVASHTHTGPSHTHAQQ